MNPSHFGPNIIIAVSRRTHGNMRLHGHDLYDEPAYERRAEFLSGIGIDPNTVVSAELIHGAYAEIIGTPPFNPKMRIKNVDTLITDRKGIALSVTNADCPTIFFYHAITGVVGISHAGWKGILAGVVESALLKMETEFNCGPSGVQVYLGPGIKKCHFEVGEDVARKFSAFATKYKVLRPIESVANATDPNTPTWEEKYQWRVDLFAAIKHRLVESGVPAENMGDCGRCTYCFKAITDLRELPEKSKFEYQYHSARRDKSDPLETQMAVIIRN